MKRTDVVMFPFKLVLSSHKVDLNSETFTNDFDQIAPSSMYNYYIVLTHCLICTPVNLDYDEQNEQQRALLLTQLRTV